MNPANKDTAPLKITLRGDIRQIPRLEDFVAELASRSGMDPSLAMSVNLALEEAVTNVLLYAYPEGEDAVAHIEARTSAGSVTIILTDSGTPFDPTAAAPADTSLGVEERPIGGLGIFLVRQIMDSVNYRYEGGMNILTMTKNF